MTLDQVAEEVAVSHGQVYAFVRAGDLPAIKISDSGPACGSPEASAGAPEAQ